MPAFENQLLLVDRSHVLDQGLRGVVRDDVIVLGNRVQDGRADVAEIGALAAERQLALE